MRDWLVLATNLAVDAIDWLALILIVVGAIEAFFQGLWTMFASRDGHYERRLAAFGSLAGRRSYLPARGGRSGNRDHHKLGRGGATRGDRRDPYLPQLFSRA